MATGIRGLWALVLAAACMAKARVVTDMAGRKVRIPDHVGMSIL